MGRVLASGLSLILLYGQGQHTVSHGDLADDAHGVRKPEPPLRRPPANEYVNLESEQVSTSRDWAVWMPDILDRYDVDSIRYMLASIMPETSDSDFNWAEFVRRNNDELVATYGNLVHRVLSMVGRNFDRTVPNPGDLDEESKRLLEEAASGLDAVTDELERCRFRNALQAAMGIARSANRYLDSKAPWQAVRSDKDDAARSLWTAMTVINCLKTALYPSCPGLRRHCTGYWA